MDEAYCQKLLLFAILAVHRIYAMTQKQQKLGTLLGVLCAQGCLLASDGNHEGIKSAPFNDVIVPVANLGPMAGPRVCKLVQNGEV